MTVLKTHVALNERTESDNAYGMGLALHLFACLLRQSRRRYPTRY